MKFRLRHSIRLVTVIGLVLAIVMASFIALTQHRQQQSHQKQLHLQQIAAALRDYLRDHPRADQSWPASFVAGNQADSIWCPALQRSVSIWDLASLIKSYLYLFPLDPSKDTPGISGYYLQRTDTGWHVGACSQDRQFEIAL